MGLLILNWVEAVTVLDLTFEQMETFEREWLLYLQKTQSMRQEARSLISFLDPAGENLLSICPIEGAGKFIDRLKAVQELEKHASKEAKAVTDLIHWLTVNFSIKQKAILMKYSVPYYPDVIQIGRILFEKEDTNVNQIGRVESVQEFSRTY
jgi:hypothetical protein